MIYPKLTEISDDVTDCVDTLARMTGEDDWTVLLFFRKCVLDRFSELDSSADDEFTRQSLPGLDLAVSRHSQPALLRVLCCGLLTISVESAERYQTLLISFSLAFCMGQRA